MSSSCGQCNQFRSARGLLVRAFECEGDWHSMRSGRATAAATAANGLHLPIERYGPGHVSSFYPPAYGASLLELASRNSSDTRLSVFNKCAQREVNPPIQRVGRWVGSAGPRPTSLLLEKGINVRYATYANSFGFTLRKSTQIIGAHAFDAWTTKQRPFCEDESLHAAVRLDFVRQFCHGEPITSKMQPCKPGHCGRLGRGKTPRRGKLKLNSSRLNAWPRHVALSRSLAASAANCRFKSLPSMVHQQQASLALSHSPPHKSHSHFVIHITEISH